MINEERIKLIEEIFGAEDAKLVKNRHRGGCSGAKGLRYEDCFAVYQIAKLARRYFEEGKESTIAAQVVAFVDDLEVCTPADSHIENFQLKNTSHVAWNEGDSSIASDFCKQRWFNTKYGYGSAEGWLVVADPDRATSLQRCLPIDLQDYGRVKHFHYAQSLALLMRQENEMREEIGFLCARSEEIDKVEAVAVVLLGVWADSPASSGQPVNIRELVAAAKKCQPSYVRSIEEPPPLREAVSQILSAIPNFIYTLDKGFFSWQHLEWMDSGILPYDCTDDRFKKFQELILKQSPVSFFELEILLLS